MKRIFIKIAFVLISGSLIHIACSKQDYPEYIPVNQIDLDTITLSASMKGWELYSWQNGNDWNYSLLPGTNINKSYQSIVSNNILVFGKDSLMLLLSKLNDGEQIFWLGKPCIARFESEDFKNLSLPGDKVINEIKEFCVQNNLEMNVCQ